MVVRVDVQLELPCRPYPFGGNADESEHEGLDAARLLQSECFCVKFVHELPCARERLHRQAVRLRGRVEVIALACVRGVGRVSCGQF